MLSLQRRWRAKSGTSQKTTFPSRTHSRTEISVRELDHPNPNCVPCQFAILQNSDVWTPGGCAQRSKGYGYKGNPINHIKKNLTFTKPLENRDLNARIGQSESELRSASFSDTKPFTKPDWSYKKTFHETTESLGAIIGPSESKVRSAQF